MAEPEAENILRLCSNLYFHFYFGLLHILLGLLALVFRFLPPKLRNVHKYLGQAFLYATVIQISTSLYVRNDGFRWFIYLFLMICIANLIIGHASIRHYQKKKNEFIIETLEAKLKSKVDINERTAESSEEGDSSSSDEASPQGQVTLNNDEIEKKLIVFKRIHGFSMILCWLMVLGAGVMFVRRSANLKNCQDLYAVDDQFQVGAVLYENSDGRLVVGFPPDNDL